MLIAGALYANVSHINPVAIQGQVIAERLEGDLNDLKDGFKTYINAHGIAPNSLAQLTPEYVFLPPSPGDSSWTYGNGVNGNYFCLSGNFRPSTVRAILDLERAFSPQAYFINTNCGVTADAKPARDAAAFSGAITLWVSSYQETGVVTSEQ